MNNQKVFVDCGIIKKNIMKTTIKGYRINKNGKINKSFEEGAVVDTVYLGQSFKIRGAYYFLNRKQGNSYIYLT